MIINKLTGKNFSNFNSFEYTFNQGITLINGKNLSGKSSILDLIRFSIYGKCKKARKIEFFKKRGSRGALESNINFTYRNETWEISRQYASKKHQASLKINDDLKAEGAEDVEKYLADNFVSEKFLCNSNLVQQKDTTGLLDSKDTERFNICKKIFDLDYLKKISDTVKTDLSEETAKLISSKSKFEFIKTQITEVESSLGTVDISTLNIKLSEFSALNDTLVSKKNELTVKKMSITTEIANIHSTNQEIIKYNQQKKQLENEIAKLDTEILLLKNKIISTGQVILTNSEKVKENNKNIEVYTDKLSNISIKRIIPFNDSELINQYGLLAEQTSKIKSCEESISFANKGICPTCKQAITNIDVSLLNKQLEEYNLARSSIVSVIDNLMKDKQQKTNDKNENDLAIQEKNKLESSIENFSNQISMLSVLIDKDTESNKDYTKKVEDLIQKKELVSADLTNFKEKDLVISDSLQKELDIITSEIASVETGIYTNKINTDKINKDIMSFDSLKNRLEILNSNLKKEEEIILEKSKLVNNLEEVRIIYEKKLPLFIVLNKLKFIASEANNFLHKTFDKFTISFEQEKDALHIILTDNVTGMVSDFDNLSGFEGGLVGLSIRMGFSSYNTLLNKDSINWIALDEVDSDFEDANSEVLFKNIMNIKDQFKQIIMITHKNIIKEILKPNNYIEVTNDKLNSSIEVL